ncbi:MAG: hypothetical protein KC442_09060, partial [Thermomicrobiales bacterium]|nr:hypothetical protein [Thermomicrobiales bacterium]
NTPALLQDLRTLVANSLVRRADASGDDSHFAMLETVREFGLERLDASDEASAIRLRHAEFYLALAERAAAGQHTRERDLWLDTLEGEQGNLHAALAWAIAQGEAEIAAAFCGALLPFWQFRFYSAVGLDWVRRTLALTQPVTAPVLRRALYCAGTLAYMDGEHATAATLLADTLVRTLEAGDQELTGRVEVGLGRLAWDDDDLEAAHRWFASSQERFAQCGDQVGLAHSLHGLGLVAYKAGETGLAATYLQDALHLWQSFGFTWELARCIPGHLADVARAAGDLSTAVRLYQECLALNWAAQDLENVSWSLAGLALIAADPARKSSLLNELEGGKGLQEIILSYGENSAASARTSEGARVASVVPPSNVSEVKSAVTSKLESIIYENRPDGAGQPIDLVRMVQGELQRLGCYRMAIDGDWGRGSQGALRDFFRETGQVMPLELQPSVQVLSALYLQSGRVCRAPVPIVKTPSASSSVATKTPASKPAATTKSRQRTTSNRPPPLPPDISAGIGIGGVF